MFKHDEHKISIARKKQPKFDLNPLRKAVFVQYHNDFDHILQRIFSKFVLYSHFWIFITIIFKKRGFSDAILHKIDIEFPFLVKMENILH